MVRTNDIVIPPATSWLNDPAARAVVDALAQAGFEVFFVGGCVRNALLGAGASDVDLATNARPEQVIKIAKAAGLKAIPTGIDHGTITVVADGAPFEVTTYRRDVETDGRRAIVAFSDDIADDARRRDFTMNALYAGIDGRVIDPLGGLPDLLARRVRFIEDADARIKEDYLRILRFYRFSAWYADPAEGFDPDALAAIADNTYGLETLSVERILQEIAKLLAAPDPALVLASMQQTGVSYHVLRGTDPIYVAPIVHFEGLLGLRPDWRVRMAALGAAEVVSHLRLSKADGQFLSVLMVDGYGGPSLGELAYRWGIEIAQGALLLRSALAEQMPEMHVLETISEAAKAIFPIKAADLMPTYQGPELGQKLGALEQDWIDSGFALTRAELLGQA